MDRSDGRLAAPSELLRRLQEAGRESLSRTYSHVHLLPEARPGPLLRRAGSISEHEGAAPPDEPSSGAGSISGHEHEADGPTPGPSAPHSVAASLSHEREAAHPGQSVHVPGSVPEARTRAARRTCASAVACTSRRAARCRRPRPAGRDARGCGPPRCGSRAPTRRGSSSRCAVTVSPRLGSRPELAEDEAADRVVGVGVDRQLEAVVEQVGDRDVAAHEPVAVGQPPDLAARRVGLVVDLADDLLDDVLDGDDPGGAAVLVDRRPPATSAGAAGRRAGRPAAWSPGRSAPRARAARATRAAPRPSAAARASWSARCRCTRSRLSSSVTTSRVWPEETQRRSAVSTSSDSVDGDDRRDRRHHLARLLLVQVEDAGEHPGLARVELAAGHAPGRIRTRSSSGVSPSSSCGRPDATPQQPQDRVGRRVEQRDERLQPDVEDLQRPGDAARDPVSALMIA